MNLTNSIKDRLEKAIAKEGVEPDLIDIKALWNSSLGYSENREIILEETKKYSDKKSITNRMIDILNIRQQKHDNDVSEQIVKEITVPKIKPLNKDLFIIDHPLFKKRLFHAINMVIQNHVTGCIIASEGGLGKSGNSMAILNEHSEDYTIYNTYTTPLSLYKTLFENNGNIILFDDVERLITDEKSISILKAALWSTNKKRFLSYKSTSKALGTVPEMFEFTGRCIILCNTLNLKNPNLRALTTRVPFMILEPTHKEKLEVMGIIASQPYKELTLEERREIFEFIRDKASPAMVNLNLRILIRSFEMFIYARNNHYNWKEIIQEELEVDEDLELIMNLRKENITIREQIREFREKTGKSARTYYNYAKKLTKRMGG